MSELLSLTVIGLCTAAIFALAASGLVLTYTTTGIFNFAHGAIGMLGAFAYWQLQVDWGWPVWLSLLVVLALLAPALGVAIEHGIMRGLTDAPETVRLVVSLSLLAALLGLGLYVWSPQEPHSTRLLFPGHRVRIFDVNVSWHQASAFVLAGLTAAGLRLLLHRTRAGLDMRASVDSRPLAMLHGARPDRSALLAWSIGCSLAALAGILIAPLSSLSHTNLTLLIVNAYAAAMIGRLRSLPLTFAGAVVLGLADSYAIGYVPTGNAYFSTFRFALPVVILFVVLLVIPPPTLRTRATAASREDIPRPSWRGSLLVAAGIVTTAGVLAGLLTEADALRTAKIFGLALIALSLVPLAGFAGQISLCQMSFAGIGAVLMAHHGQGGDPLMLGVVGVACGAIGALIALPALRLSGIYLALATAAFAVFLDRWVFNLPNFDLGPWTIKLFEFGTLPVDPIDVPGVGESRRAQLVTLAVAFAFLYLVVVGIRRSTFGHRLLAMKDSPAACATLGIDVTRMKLAVFALSSAMAGVGGALFAGTMGSVSAQTFSLFESLPLLLFAVVGGIGSASGALFAGLALGGFPIAVGVWPWLSSLNLVFAGTLGVALGRNPNGAVSDVAAQYRVLGTAPVALVGLVVTVASGALLAAVDVLSGWGLLYWVATALVVWPATAQIAQRRRELSTRERIPDLEWAGVDRPFSAAELAVVARGLGLEGSQT